MPSGTFIKHHVTRLIKHQWVSCRGICCYRVYQLIAQIYWIYLWLDKISCFLRASIFPSAWIWASITELVYLISFNEQWHWQWFNFGVTLSFRRRDGEHEDNHPIRHHSPANCFNFASFFAKFNWTYAGNSTQRLRPLSDLESLGARGKKKAHTRSLARPFGVGAWPRDRVLRHQPQTAGGYVSSGLILLAAAVAATMKDTNAHTWYHK